MSETKDGKGGIILGVAIGSVTGGQVTANKIVCTEVHPSPATAEPPARREPTPTDAETATTYDLSNDRNPLDLPADEREKIPLEELLRHADEVIQEAESHLVACGVDVVTLRTKRNKDMVNVGILLRYLLRKSDRLLAIADWSRDDKLARREGIKREFGSNSLVAKLGIPRDGTWKVVWKKVVEARLFPSGGGQPPVASSRHDEDRPALIAQILSEIRRALSEGLLSRREAEDLALEVEGASEERLVDLREIIETKGRLK